MVYRIGNVRLAETQAQLFDRGRAIMRDGTYDDGIAIEVRRPVGGLLIGRAAASLMLERLERELADQRAMQERHAARESFLRDTLGRLTILTASAEGPERLGSLAESHRVQTRRCAELHEQIDKIAAQGDPKLQERLEALKARQKELQKEEVSQTGELGRVETRLADLEKRLGGGEQLVGSRLCLAHRRRLFRSHVGSLAQLRALLPLYRQRIGEREHGAVAAEAQDFARSLGVQRQACDAKLRAELVEYRMTFAVTLPFDGDAPVLSTVGPWVSENVAALEENELIRFRRQADEAAERISQLFRSSFINELNMRVGNLEQAMQDLQAALRQHPLHGEVYSLHAKVRPRFASLIALAKESTLDERLLLPLFGRLAPPDGPHAAALAEVERLLQDETLDFTEYQDYRNYYDFELKMRDLEAQREYDYERRRGTASGAERQVPFYVVIGAALASIYHGTRRGAAPRGLGLAVFDEAFSKLDGRNQRTLLAFYAASGLQTLIAAPSEKRTVVYENVDCIVDVHRFGDWAETDVAQLKPQARAALREINPDYLTDEERRARLAAELRATD